AATGAGITLLAAAVLLHEHRDVETHQRANISRQLALARGYQDDLVHGGDTGGDVHDARINAASLAIYTLEPRNLVVSCKRSNRIRGQVEPVPRLRVPCADAPLAAVNGDRARCTRGFLEGGQDDLVGVGEPRLLTRERPHADTLRDARAALLDEAVLERPEIGRASCRESAADSGATIATKQKTD